MVTDSVEELVGLRVLVGLSLGLALRAAQSQLAPLGELPFLCVETADLSDVVGLRSLRSLVLPEFALKAEPFGLLNYF